MEPLELVDSIEYKGKVAFIYHDKVNDSYLCAINGNFQSEACDLYHASTKEELKSGIIQEIDRRDDFSKELIEQGKAAEKSLEWRLHELQKFVFTASPEELDKFMIECGAKIKQEPAVYGRIHELQS